MQRRGRSTGTLYTVRPSRRAMELATLEGDRMRHRIWLAVAALAALAGCEEAESARMLPTVEVVDGVEVATLPPIPDPLDPDYSWELRVVREVRTVLPESPEPLVFDPARVLPLTSGALLVADPPADRPLILLDPDTESVFARFGSKGQGPGEMGRSTPLMLETEDGTLIVLDASNRQLHRYAPDGHWISSQRLEIETFVQQAMLARDRPGFVVGVPGSMEEQWRRRLEIVDAGTGASEPLLTLPEPEGPAAGIWQRGRVLWTVLPGGIVGTWGHLPSASVYDHDGTLRREIRLPLTRRSLTEEDIEDQRARYGPIANGLRPGPMGFTNALHPVNDTVFGMHLSRLWRAEEDPPIPEGRILWRLVSVRGEYVGVVPQPEDFRYLGAGNGTFWMRVLDERAQPVIQEVELARAGDDGPG